jgi:hypothetical protein
MLSLLYLLLCYAPTEKLSVQVLPQWQNQGLELNRPYAIENDTLTIQQWKCYIQVCALYSGKQLVFSFPKNHYLLNVENKASLQWTIDVPYDIEYDAIECEVGVDSTIQMQGVQENALDPENDMYWSWQSGYIHTKLEATSTHHNRQYTLHIGGFRSPYNTLSRFRVPIVSDTIRLICPVDAWMNYAQKSPLSNIMQPCIEAKKMANAWASLWYTSQP